ncbi:hypothetical protein Tco_0011546 [Tanacetum coccineum]
MEVRYACCSREMEKGLDVAANSGRKALNSILKNSNSVPRNRTDVVVDNVGNATAGRSSLADVALNLILLTSSELMGLRDLLKLSLYNAAVKDFFFHSSRTWKIFLAVESLGWSPDAASACEWLKFNNSDFSLNKKKEFKKRLVEIQRKEIERPKALDIEEFAALHEGIAL